jgi:dGTPase
VTCHRFHFPCRSAVGQKSPPTTDPTLRKAKSFDKSKCSDGYEHFPQASWLVQLRLSPTVSESTTRFSLSSGFAQENMRLDWSRLLCDWRTPYPGREPGASRNDVFRSHFESDYDRIVYSQPFRRLARKTQVHPMAPNDHVHNRLTHSIEVASVGRSFAARLAHLLSERHELPAERTATDLTWILMAACAVHDIGNPPFGHAGEYAIREWSACHLDIVFPRDMNVEPDVVQDMLLFEGNAQGFRLAARCDNDHLGHLRLTFATLGAMVKYPWTSTDDRAKSLKKYNCFSTEAEIFQCVFQSMGLERDGLFLRHPLSFLSEAADDICYRVLDLEDAVELGIISADRVRSIFACFLADRPELIERVADRPISMVRGMVIQRLIEESWQIFESDYDRIMQGDRTDDLKSSFPEGLKDGLRLVNEVYQEIFSEAAKVSVELGAFNTLGRILRTVCNAVADMKRMDDPAKLMFLSRRTLELAWEKPFVAANRHQSYSWWLHQVLDYVSGLTDNFSRQLSREIEGT